MDIYQKLWEQEMKAHKYTISKLLEARGSIKRLLEINNALVNVVEKLKLENSQLKANVGVQDTNILVKAPLFYL